jgi:hypothetical protein
MAARTRHGATTRCGACGAPLIRQPGEVIAVAVDATPIPPGTDPQIRGPNRLTWCAPPTRSGTTRLMWIYTGHPADCPHPHHVDHQCTARPAPAAAPPAPTADTLF